MKLTSVIGTALLCAAFPCAVPLPILLVLLYCLFLPFLILFLALILFFWILGVEDDKPKKQCHR
jgi:hypothetical protein